MELSIPSIWNTYYTAGRVDARLNNNVIDVRLTGLPIWHVSFEYMVMGYAKRAFELLGNNVQIKKIKSVALGDREIYYQFILA